MRTHSGVVKALRVVTIHFAMPAAQKNSMTRDASVWESVLRRSWSEYGESCGLSRGPSKSTLSHLLGVGPGKLVRELIAELPDAAWEGRQC